MAEIIIKYKIRKITCDLRLKIDDKNLFLLNNMKISFHPRFGAMIYSTKEKPKCLSRIIMKAPVGFIVDHKDHNNLNCLEENMRVCFQNNNIQNSRKKSRIINLAKKSNLIPRSNYKGVAYQAGSFRRKRWKAIIKANGKSLFLGSFETEKEAAEAYDRAAKRYFGEFACINFN